MSLAGRRLTLLEVTISSALCSTLLLGLYAVTAGTQRQVSEASFRRAAQQRAHRLCQRLAAELSGLNDHELDLEPDLPAGEAALSYRTVVGYDLAADRAQLSPSRASGAFRQLRLEGEQVIQRREAGGEVTLASAVEALSFRRVGPRALQVEVWVRAGDERASSQVVIALRNKLEEAQ